MPRWTSLALRAQLALAKRSGVYALLRDSAARQDVPLAYVLAIASRETGIRNILGDGGHGVGVIQIDIRHHELARLAKERGTWKNNPLPLIDYGIQMLWGNRRWAAREWPELTSTQHLKIAAAAYNAGRGGARAGADDGDCDLRTTGRDYGRDVLARMAVFETLIGG